MITDSYEITDSQLVITESHIEITGSHLDLQKVSRGLCIPLNEMKLDMNLVPV